jgi:RHS repeat-associated protein
LVYFHRNQHYSVTAITTSTGAIAERYAYTAYGQPTILDASGTVLQPSNFSLRYSFTGREWDATLSLYHFRARWMSPSAGGFVTRDSIGIKGGILLYGNYWWLRSADPHRLQSLNAGGGRGPPPPKTRDQNCKTNCCRPVGITATSAQPDDLPPWS